MKLRRRLTLCKLDDRTLPAMTFSLTGNTVSILGDAAADSLTLSTTAGGQLQHNQSGIGGLASNTDLNPAVSGTQALAVTALTGFTIDLGSGSDTLSVTSVATAIAMANIETFNFSCSPSEPNAAISLTNSSLTVNNVPAGYSYNLSGTTASTVTGGTGNNIISASTWTIGSLTISGGTGNDTITGGSGPDLLSGNDGDDQLFSRDASPDILNGGNGTDQASFDASDGPSAVEVWNPMPASESNRSQKVKVLVVNYDPLVPSQGNKHLYELFGWSKPQDLAAGYEEALERTSGGAASFEIVEWRNLNDMPYFTDGFKYTADEYYANRLAGSGWHATGMADAVRSINDQGIPAMVDSGTIDEVWFFGDHFMFFQPGGGFGEAFMAGPNSFFINGPVYSQVPTVRPFACYGFSYERGVAEMLHNTAHRMENHGNRTWGSWNLANPTSNWDKFSANVTQSNGVAGVGTCHYPPNALSDYDYGNTTLVSSWADDFLDYPQFTSATTLVNRNNWRQNSATTDDQKAFLEWYFHHMPRGDGVNADGRQNNWWKYLYDYDNYNAATGTPKAFRSGLMASDLYNLGGTDYTFQVYYTSPKQVNIASLDSQDVRVTGPNGFNQLAKFVGASDTQDGPYRVATYRISAPGGTWDAAERGAYSIVLQANEVADDAGTLLGQTVLGGFNIRGAGGLPLENDADTALLLKYDGSPNGAAGETPTAIVGASYPAGLVGSAAVSFASPGYARYSNSGNLTAAAGTVEFWIKPGWNGNANITHAFFEAGDNFNNGLLLAIDGANNLRAIMWGDDPTTGTVETAVERGVGVSGSSWVSGQWHHFAATWNGSARTMALYIDGQLRSSISNNVQLTSFSNSVFTLGAEQNAANPSLAAFDEVRISNRARTAAEISSDYQAAIATSSISVSPPSVSLTPFDRQRLTATSLSTSGVSRTVTRQVVWSTSNPAVATVSADGVVTAVATGTATITATLDTLTASSAITVTDPGRPTGTLTPVSDITTPGTTPLNFTVTYNDDAGVNVSLLENRDLWVHSANGISGHATFLSVTPAGNGSPRTATYQFRPPQGAWDERDNGLYFIETTDWQVGDTAGNFVPAAGLGSFRVRINVPTVATPMINGGIQRSRVTAITVPFSSPMTLGFNAFTLLGPSGRVPLQVASNGTNAIITFTGAGLNSGSLADGRYTLTLHAASSQDAFGQQIDGDGDGLPGGDLSFNFHRLFGDIDGNGTVNAIDFAEFGNAFGQTVSNSPFDFNNDGTIQADDFAEFGNRFGVTL